MLAFIFQFDSAAQAIAAWCGLALTAILVLLRHPTTLTLISDKKGRLSISRHALNRLIEVCCEQVSGVAGARVFVRRHRAKLSTSIRLKIRPNAKVDAIQGYLIQEITTIYQDNLGIKEVGPIEVKVIGVIAEEGKF